MSLSIEALPSGAFTASLSGLCLHSRRSPEREAERFLASRLKADSRAFIIMGSCLGYLDKAVADKLPGAPVISVQYDRAFRGREICGAKSRWYPDSSEALDSFILSRLDPADLDGLEILDWPPAAQAYPKQAADCMEGLRKAVLALNGSVNAMQAFGVPCLVNAVRNASFGADFRSLVHASRSVPVVIAASGPSLAEHLDEIGKNRGRFILGSLSSAATALASASIKPDFVVSSDSGYWARLHLERLAWHDVPIVFPLTANIPRAVLANNPLLALDSGNAFEGSVFRSAGLRGLSLPASGTVAATALDFSLLLSDGPVMFAGLDLGARDILSHARPHAFEAYHSRSASRLYPEYSSSFCREADRQAARVGRYRVSPQLDTYAGYFSRAARRHGRVFRLPSGAPPVLGLENATLGSLCGPSVSPGQASIATQAQGPLHPQRSWSTFGAASRLIRECFTHDSQDKLGEAELAALELISFSRLMKMRKAERSGDAAAYGSAAEDLRARSLDIALRLDRLGAAPTGKRA